MERYINFGKLPLTKEMARNILANLIRGHCSIFSIGEENFGELCIIY